MEVGKDAGIVAVRETMFVGDAGEKLFGNDDVAMGDGDGERHDVLEVVGFDFAVPMEVAAVREDELAVVGGELTEEFLNVKVVFL